MNVIQMYGSSSQLRWGLHRALAVAHSLAVASPPNETICWWQALDESVRDDAREHALSLPELADVYAERPCASGLIAHGASWVYLPSTTHKRSESSGLPSSVGRPIVAMGLATCTVRATRLCGTGCVTTSARRLGRVSDRRLEIRGPIPMEGPFYQHR